MTIVLLNPNTNAATTAAMLSIARAAAPPGIGITGVTAPFGADIIATPGALEVAAEAVLSLVPSLAGARAVIVAAFGDPGLRDLRAALGCPVTGLAEAAIAEAARDGRRFAIVSMLPALSAGTAARIAPALRPLFAGVWIAGEGAPERVARGRPEYLAPLLDAACRRAVAEGGAETVVIGGGPLAPAARLLAERAAVPIIEPLPAATRLCLARLGSGEGHDGA
jgi:Asp/Glu/hydantoin racemase